MIERRFPVLYCHNERTVLVDSPLTVPWLLLAPHEGRVIRNHGQNLDVLAKRGGLGLSEIVAILEDRKWASMTVREANERVKTLVFQYEQNTEKKD